MWFCVSLSFKQPCPLATWPVLCHTHNASRLPVTAPKDNKVSTHAHKHGGTRKTFNLVILIQYNEQRPAAQTMGKSRQSRSLQLLINHLNVNHSVTSGLHKLLIQASPSKHNKSMKTTNSYP